MDIKNKFCVSDLILIILVVLFTVMTFLLPLLSGDGDVVVIKHGGVTDTYSLRENRTVEIESSGVKMVVKIEDGYVWVEDADCPDGICESTGRIHSSGRGIVCVPAEVSVYIVSGGGEENDIVAG